ncbi:MAG TPA: methylmalonyl-CoA epimerase [Chloroflexota bacterium]|nr:methylmalonyl-CoA epimerase [Chloroflexota bacterium]
MNPRRIDHTAIAVVDLDEAIPRFERLFSLRLTDRAAVPDQQVDVAFLAAGDTLLELISPTGDDSGVARFLRTRGESLHHIAFAVYDIRRALDDLRGEGVRLIDVEPRRGPHGLIAFVHPQSTGGVLVELVQHVEDQALQA